MGLSWARTLPATESDFAVFLATRVLGANGSGVMKVDMTRTEICYSYDCRSLAIVQAMRLRRFGEEDAEHALLAEPPYLLSSKLFGSRVWSYGLRFRVQGCIVWFLSQAHASQLWVRKVNLEEQRFRKSNDCLDARGACFSRAQEP